MHSGRQLGIVDGKLFLNETLILLCFTGNISASSIAPSTGKSPGGDIVHC